ncbi:hypothetical protein Fmac_020776 [Flemingia macrophylla]|uniref:Uncharacterized protein n=1 Tax=Flemingia macrophylla TaxID=520843 RepID=A0ABD1LV07_9FABA
MKESSQLSSLVQLGHPRIELETSLVNPAFGIPLLVVKVTTSGMANSHSVTGSVYKARK